MGQMTIGIMFGIKLPQGWHWEFGANCNVDDDSDGIAEKCYEAFESQIQAATSEPGESVVEQFIPDVDYESNLIGFWVAAGASGKPGCPDLVEGGAIPLRDLDQMPPYDRAITVAQERWARFAKWAEKSENVGLPEPRLWILNTEVA